MWEALLVIENSILKKDPEMGKLATKTEIKKYVRVCNQAYKNVVRRVSQLEKKVA